jgi:hypothetical protein
MAGQEVEGGIVQEDTGHWLLVTDHLPVQLNELALQGAVSH